MNKLLDSPGVTAGPSLTQAPRSAAASAWATMFDAAALQAASIDMEQGPTGRSVYWPELFGVLHPAYVTTDTAFNLVDQVWMPEVVRVRIYVTDVPSLPLARIVRALRDTVPLPAADLAAMLGLRRRQLYNLLAGSRASAERQKWIQFLAEQIETLNAATSEDRELLRAALLHPIDDGRSFYDDASAEDEHRVRAAVARLVPRLQSGTLRGRVKRPSPRLARHGSPGAAADFLSGYQGTEDEPGG